MEIKTTKNYTIFKEHPANRDLDEANVVDLMSSMQSKDLQKVMPILVNKQMQVMDGNHRLEAAKRLGKEVHYQVLDLTEDDIRLLNIKKSWKSNDYLKYYVSRGLQPYVKFKEFIEKNKLNISQGFIYISHLNAGSWKNFKSGILKFPEAEKEKAIYQNVDKVKKVLDLIKEKKIDSAQICRSCRFREAVIDFVSDERVDFAIFCKKLEMNLGRVSLSSRKIDYLNIFKEIYNWRNSAKIE